MKNKAHLNINDSKIELDLVQGSENEVGVDISGLRIKSNLITLDPGYKNTGSCKSKITFRYRWLVSCHINRCWR